MLEESLRKAFEAAAARPPTVDRLADRVIARGRRSRRRRQVLAGVAAALALSLIAAGAARLTRDGTAIPSGPAPTPSVETTINAFANAPVDILLGRRILTVGGRTVALDGTLGAADPALVRVQGAWRVAEGWLVQTLTYGEVTDHYYDWTERLWLVGESAGVAQIVTGHAILVGAPRPGQVGVQIAWVAEGELKLGVWRDASIDEVASIPVPYSPQPHPVRLHAQRAVGPAILLAGTQTGGGLDSWGAWFPGSHADNDYPSISLLGVTLDRERAIANYAGAGQQRCLGELDPVGFTPVRSRCPSPATDVDRILPSPDGRWWIMAGPNGVALYDADRIWDEAPPAQTWPDVGSGEWAGDVFVIVSQGSLALLRPGDQQATELMQVPPAPEVPTVIEDLRRFQS